MKEASENGKLPTLLNFHERSQCPFMVNHKLLQKFNEELSSIVCKHNGPRDLTAGAQHTQKIIS